MKYDNTIQYQLIFPLNSKRGNRTSPITGGFHWKIIYKWRFLHIFAIAMFSQATARKERPLWRRRRLRQRWSQKAAVGKRAFRWRSEDRGLGGCWQFLEIQLPPTGTKPRGHVGVLSYESYAQTLKSYFVLTYIDKYDLFVVKHDVSTTSGDVFPPAGA